MEDQTLRKECTREKAEEKGKWAVGKQKKHRKTSEDILK